MNLKNRPQIHKECQVSVLCPKEIEENFVALEKKLADLLDNDKVCDDCPFIKHCDDSPWGHGCNALDALREIAGKEAK